MASNGQTGLDGSTRPSIDARLSELARRQHGVVALRQLIRLGLTRQAVAFRAKAGRLHRIHAGVYAVGHPALTTAGYRMAAVLACGSGAVISHQTAGDAHAIRRSASVNIHVTVPRQVRKHLANVVVHRTGSLHADDVTVAEGIPITSVARTIVDLAATVTAHQLERVIDKADELRVLDLRALDAAIARANGRRGTGTVRAALILARDDRGMTRSEFEDRFYGLMRSVAHLPYYSLNSSIDVGWPVLLEVDVLFPAERLVIELDSRAHHERVRAFEDDRAKDAALAARGYLVVRITWRRLRDEPARIVAQLQEILAQRHGSVDRSSAL